MIEWVHGDIIQADADAIVNPVNTVGVAGAGLALQFRRAYPENFWAYKQACRDGLHVGSLHVYETGRGVPRFVVNFPTKRDWRELSKLSDIKAGLERLVEIIPEYGMKSVALPPLGCGLGGLDWDNQVKPLMVDMLWMLDIPVLLYHSKWS